MRISAHMHPNAAASSRKIGTNHAGEHVLEPGERPEHDDQPRQHQVERDAGDDEHEQPEDDPTTRVSVLVDPLDGIGSPGAPFGPWALPFHRHPLIVRAVLACPDMFAHRHERLADVHARFGAVPLPRERLSPMESTARRLLVSVPTLHDPNFFRSVVFMIEHTDEGALGLVLNQPTETPPRRGAATVGRRIGRAAGGRVRRRSGAAARRGDRVRPRRRRRSGRRDAWQPLLGRSARSISAARPQDARADLEAVRMFAGYSGWGPSQLDGELDAGGWFVVDALPDDLLTSDPRRCGARSCVARAATLAVSANYPLGDGSGASTD